MAAFLELKGTLAPDLALFEGFAVNRLIPMRQIAVPLRHEIAVLQFPGAPFVIRFQALRAERTALATPFIHQIQPVQPTGTAVDSIQLQQPAIGADVGVQAFERYLASILHRWWPCTWPRRAGTSHRRLCSCTYRKKSIRRHVSCPILSIVKPIFQGLGDGFPPC